MPFVKGQIPWNKGKSNPPEVNAKIGAANKGRVQFQEEKDKRTASLLTHYKTHEASNKGHIPWNKGLAGTYTFSKKRKEVSEETKRKIAKTLTGRTNCRKGKSKYPEVDFTLERLCACGCGSNIKLTKWHKYNKIPSFIPGHQFLIYGPSVKDTSIEKKLQKILTDHNIEYKTHYAIKGTPDIFVEPNICIFADGEYWHANPKSFKEDAIIIGKLTAKDIWCRDKNITNSLLMDNYIVLRFWENDIHSNIDKCLSEITNAIKETKDVF